MVLGRLRARRGDAGDWEMLDAALQAAQAAGYLELLAMVHAAPCRGRVAARRARQVCRGGTRGLRHRRAVPISVVHGELAGWRHVAGDTFELPDVVATPYASMIAGRWQEAADAWLKRRSPFEQALALMHSHGAAAPQAQREAIEILEGLGATSAAKALRRRLREAGVRGLPRGPRPATRANAFGLTRREQQVLVLLCEALRNAEIAARLHRSVRIVDQHLEEPLAKLGVDSRLAAAQSAARAGLLSRAQSGQAPANK